MTPKFGINSPQTVKHISQKAFFKHALKLKKLEQNVSFLPDIHIIDVYTKSIKDAQTSIFHYL